MQAPGILTLLIAAAVGTAFWAAIFRSSDKACRWLCLVLLFCLMGWMVVYRSQQLCLYSDTPVHLAMIEKEAQCGLFPGDPFFPGFPTPLHYSPLHVIGGALVTVAGLSVEGSWMVLGLLYAGLLFFSSLLFGRALFGDVKIAWVQALLTTLWLCLGDMVPHLGLSSVFSTLLAMSLLLDSAQRQTLSWLWVVCIAAIMGFALAVRLYPGLPGYLLLLVLICFLLGRLHEMKHRSAKAIFLVLCPIILAWPWLSLVFDHGQGSGMAHVPGWPGWDVYWAIRLNYLREMWLWKYAGPAIAGRLCLCLMCLGGCVLLFTRMLSRTTRLFMGWMIGSLVVCWLIPVELCLAGSLSGDQMRRMGDIFGRFTSLIAPMALAFGVILYCKRQAASAMTGRAWAWSSLALLCLILLCLGPASSLRLKTTYGHAMRPRLDFLHSGKEKVFSVLRGRTVLSDSWTSYLTQHALGTYVVAIPEGHSSEMVDVRYRSNLIAALFSGVLPESSVRRLMAKYHVEFILINKVLAENRPIPHLEVKAVEYSGFNSSYMKKNPLFTLYYEDEDVLLLAVTIPHG